MGAVSKVLDIVGILLNRKESITILELAEITGTPASTLYRIVSELVSRGFVTRHAGGRYTLGPVFLRFSKSGDVDKLVDLALPYLSQLSGEVNQSVNLAILQGNKAVCVLIIHHILNTNMANRTALVVPLHSTSVGKILLAYLEPAMMKTIIKTEGLQDYTKNTITDFSELEQSLADTRERGIAFDYEEYHTGLASIAAPIKDASGSVIAASGILGHPQELRKSRLKEVIPPLKKCTGEISRALGYKGEIEELNGQPIRNSTVSVSRKS